MFFFLFGLFGPLIMFLVFAQVAATLAVAFGPVLIVLFVVWVIYRMMRTKQ